MTLHINGKTIEVPDTLADKPLLDFLREDLDLTGVKQSCNIGACGACTVLLDNEPTRCCLKKVRDAAGRRLLTIEGMAGPQGGLHPLQQSFVDEGAVQCGYCIPGMVLASHALLLKNPNPDRGQIRHALRNHLCRCTGYQQIVNAVQNAARHYQEASPSPSRPALTLPARASQAAE